jgi:hypothetical protein
VLLLAATLGVVLGGAPPASAAPGDLMSTWEKAGYLQVGSGGNTVMSVQGYMMQSGYYERENRFIDAYERGTGRDCSTSYAVSVDGYFGGCTRAAVQGFQEQHGLATDGIVGTYTWRALQNMTAHSPDCRLDGRICPYGDPSHIRPFSHDYRYDGFWDLWYFYYWPRNCWTAATRFRGGPCHRVDGSLARASTTAPPPSATRTPLTRSHAHEH